jgi:hypothetical protein
VWPIQGVPSWGGRIRDGGVGEEQTTLACICFDQTNRHPVLVLPLPVMTSLPPTPSKFWGGCIARRSSAARISGSSTTMLSTISGSTSRNCAMRRNSFCHFTRGMRPQSATWRVSPSSRAVRDARAISQPPASFSMRSGRPTSPSFISPSARWPAGKPATRSRWRKRCARDGGGSRRRRHSGAGEFVVCNNLRVP